MTTKVYNYFFLILTLAIFVTSCTIDRSLRYSSKTKSERHLQNQDNHEYISGICSYYGQKFHGRKTANGETFDMYDFTAAHKSLPFGTILEVENLSNSKKVTVRINDRGPFVRNRILDISYAAAKEIGMLQSGTAKIVGRIIFRPKTSK